jgi:mRNA interferase YafQ
VRRCGREIIDELSLVLDALVAGRPPAARHRDHALKGWSPPARECHVRPEVLLVYRLAGDTVELVRLGSHADLF